MIFSIIHFLNILRNFYTLSTSSLKSENCWLNSNSKIVFVFIFVISRYYIKYNLLNRLRDPINLYGLTIYIYISISHITIYKNNWKYFGITTKNEYHHNLTQCYFLYNTIRERKYTKKVILFATFVRNIQFRYYYFSEPSLRNYS